VNVGEGTKPQTLEQLWLLRLLGVERGVVAGSTLAPDELSDLRVR
jgi:hypothetical protein